MLKACIGLNCTRTIDFIDHRHCKLAFIPDDVYRNGQTLEDLLLDCNLLQELPAVSEGLCVLASCGEICGCGVVYRYDCRDNY